MAYDEELATRIRELVADEPRLTEKTMFGGLAFLVGGNMAMAASAQADCSCASTRRQSDTLVTTTPAEPMVMRGRPMTGWLHVADHV